MLLTYFHAAAADIIIIYAALRYFAPIFAAATLLPDVMMPRHIFAFAACFRHTP